MGDFPTYGGDLGFASVAQTLRGLSRKNVASTAWASANLALFVPVKIPSPVTICKLVVVYASGAGNIDVGVYNRDGVRLVSSGATAKSGTASEEHVVDVTDTFVSAGLYYLALASDGTSNFIGVPPTGTAPVPAQKVRLYGLMEMASAYPLPASATYAASTGVFVPMVQALFRGL